MKIKLLGRQYLPEYKTSGSAGADLHARGDWNIKPSETIVIPLGIFMEIPEGYEVQIRPRSGLAAKYGITILNAPGTIDGDYRGEVCAIVHNASKSLFAVRDGDRIAQMVYAPVEHALFEVVDELTDTERGTRGFGSSGVK
jgi:dUTP pyrophosphatase